MVAKRGTGYLTRDLAKCPFSRNEQLNRSSVICEQGRMPKFHIEQGICWAGLCHAPDVCISNAFHWIHNLSVEEMEVHFF